MKCSSKAALATFVFCFLALAIGEIPDSRSQPANIEDDAFAYIKDVLPLDFELYNVSVRSYELPGSPNVTYRTDSVNFLLNSTDSTESLLAVNCLFRDGVQYTCDLRIMFGSPIYLGDQSDLLQATKRIIEKHQAQTGVDSTEMLSMLDEVKSAEQFSTLTRGKIILTVSLGHVPTGLKMVNGTLHVDGTKTIGIISFRWDHLVDGGGHMFFSLSYDDGVFHGLRDERILSKIENNRESTEPLTEPATFQILAFAAALPSGAIAIAGLVFFFKKRSHTSRETTDSTKLQATSDVS